MRQVADFGDAEAAVVAFLLAQNSGLSVGTGRYVGEGERHVRVSRVGGGVDTPVTDRPVFAFECWEATEELAAQLAATTRRQVMGLWGDLYAGLRLSWQSEVGGPVFFPHPDTDAPRYQHSQQLTVDG